MNFMRFCKLHTKYIIVGVQIIILFFALSSWILHRGNAYGKVFALDEYILRDNVVVGEDVTTDEIMGESGVFLSTPALHLEKGIYQIHVNYNADRVGNIINVSCDLGTMECFAPPMELDPSVHSSIMTAEITRSTDDLRIEAFFSGSGYISITNMEIYETSGRYKKNIFYAVLLCCLISMAYCFKRSAPSARRVFLALSGLFLVTCYPLYTDFLSVGHDIPFHLLRIEAIKEGLSCGTFPVKLHPFWAKGHGYAVGIYYGDALLYFPAFLRLLGFSVQSAYKYFVALINLGTVCISYYSFGKIFTDKKTALLGSIAYSLSPYRLMDVYTRASVGEYTAMMFLPLVLCGFYLIMYGASENKPWKSVVITALGFTGLVQSHILSSLMAVFTVFLVCLCGIRRIFQKQILISLISAAAFTLLLNLNFIVPFLDFYGEDIQMNSPDWSGRPMGSFQSNGLFPIQIFTLFQKSNGGVGQAIGGIHNEPSLGIGIFLTIGMILFLYLLFIHYQELKNDKNYFSALVCTGLGALLLYMCSCYFPWDALASMGAGVKNAIYNLQFPWRLLAPATVVLTFVLCYSFDFAAKLLPRQFPSLLTGSILLLMINCGWYFYDFSFTQEPYRIYNSSELNTMTMYSYEYLPAGTNPEEISENSIVKEGILSLDSYQKLGTDITCSFSVGEEGGYIEFPLLYYKYYRCIDIDNAQSFPVHAGTNNVVRVEFPGSYSGRIQLGFREPWFWRLAECVSCLTFLMIFLSIFPWKRIREKKK